MEELTYAETLEFIAECRETEERVAFTMADLWGWDDETVFLDTSIYLNQPKEVNWAIVCKSSFGRRLNPEYNIHIRTEEESGLKEPLRLLSIKKYSRYRFEAEFSNHVVRTGSLLPQLCWIAELLFDEDEFEHAKMNPRGLQVRNDFISAMRLWKASSEYVHYGYSSEEFDIGKFKKVRNLPFSTKPFGGFWASPTKCSRINIIHPFDWKDFCHDEGYQPIGKSLYKKFYFCLDVDSCIVTIENMDDYNALPKMVAENEATGRKEEFIDFEECIRQGIDAIEYAYSIVHRDENIRDEMDMKMWGWDCDSILIMNPNIILKESFLKEIGEGFLVKG